jgi:hypothetical protein
MFGMIATLNHEGAFRSRGWGVNPPVEDSPPGLMMGGPWVGLLSFRGGSKLGWEENRGDVWETGKINGTHRPHGGQETGKPKGDDAYPTAPFPNQPIQK